MTLAFFSPGCSHFVDTGTLVFTDIECDPFVHVRMCETGIFDITFEDGGEPAKYAKMDMDLMERLQNAIKVLTIISTIRDFVGNALNTAEEEGKPDGGFGTAEDWWRAAPIDEAYAYAAGVVSASFVLANIYDPFVAVDQENLSEAFHAGMLVGEDKWFDMPPCEGMLRDAMKDFPKEIVELAVAGAWYSDLDVCDHWNWKAISEKEVAA